MGAQGWVAVVLGIGMAFVGLFLAAPTSFWPAVIAGLAVLRGRLVRGLRRLFGLPNDTTLEIGDSMHAHSSMSIRMHQDPHWGRHATLRTRIKVLRQYAAETRRELGEEIGERERLERTLKAEIRRLGRQHEERLDEAMRVVRTDAVKGVRRQFSGLPFAAVGVVLTAAGAAVGDLPQLWYLITLAVALVVPTILTLLVRLAPDANLSPMEAATEV